MACDEKSMETDYLSDTHMGLPWYHGTDTYHLDAIKRKGFREKYYCDDEIQECLKTEGDIAIRGKGQLPDPYFSTGCLGTGIYISTDWASAGMYGEHILRVKLIPGTRLVNADLPADPAVLRYLKREFGHEIFSQPLHKVLPRNKRLTLEELICLLRNLYQLIWHKGGPRRVDRYRRKNQAKIKRVERSLRNQLIRYGIHGYGSPRGELGVVVFSGDRVLLDREEVEIPSEFRWNLWGEEPATFAYESLDALKKRVEAYKRVEPQVEELKKKLADRKISAEEQLRLNELKQFMVKLLSE